MDDAELKEVLQSTSTYREKAVAILEADLVKSLLYNSTRDHVTLAPIFLQLANVYATIFLADEIRHGTASVTLAHRK